VSGTETQTVDVQQLDIQKILRKIPHRYPFLMVDRVISLQGNRIRAIKNVTVNEPHFMGHFPGKPVMPGVLQVEAMAQVAGILMMHIIGVESKLALFLSCDKVKFRKVVTPGDQLVIEADLLKNRGGKMGVASATCSVDGVVVSSSELTFALMDDI
jgi:UDP-3-O-[3-hydroxymyristoyl] N-acetylglucosamine deacetylase / 3-hydroxyacyl-[acyl-carrier-protein] dehydratase